MTRLETYQEGLKFLHQALDALDQADACMRDVEMNGVLAATGYRKPTLKQMAMDLISLCQEAENWECDECGHPIDDHDENGDCAWWNGSRYEAKGRKPTMTEAKLAVAMARANTPMPLLRYFQATIEEFDGGYDWDWKPADGDKIREAGVR